MVTLKVLKKFQDKDNKEKIYQVGETLSTSDLDRVNDLVSRGICSISAIKEANKEEKKPEKINSLGLKNVAVTMDNALNSSFEDSFFDFVLLVLA